MKTAIFLLIFCPAIAQAQQHKKQIYITQAIAGAADGLNQAVVHHYLWQNRPFWNIKESWKRKYRGWDKGDTREAFPGSKTVLVGFTDGNHLTRMVDRAATTGSIYFALRDKYTVKQAIRTTATAIIINRVFFYLIFNLITK